MKNIVITGAAGGLGISLVKEYLGRGYRVFTTDIVPEEEALKRLPEKTDQLLYKTADVSSTLPYSPLLILSPPGRTPWRS